MELSDEEKKAIEDLKKLRKGIEILNLIAEEKNEVDIKAIDIILNLIEKLRRKIDAKEMEHKYDQQMIDDLKGEMVHNWLHKDKIRKIINKYVDIDEHLKYTNQELYGEELKNIIKELLKEE